MRRVKNQSDLDPSPDFDPVFEALLKEALDGAAPADHSEKILERVTLNPAVPRPAPAPLPKTSTRTGGRHLKRLAWSTAFAAAASLLWVASTATPPFDHTDHRSTARPNPGTEETDVANEDPPGDNRHPREGGAAGDDGATSTDDTFAGADPQTRDAVNEDREPRSIGETRRVPMKLRKLPFGDDLAATDDSSASPQLPAMPAPPERKSGREIVDRIDAQLATAWSSLSLTRAETADPAEIAERFERTIAVSLTPAQFNVPEDIVRRVTRPEGHANFSRAMVDELLGPLAASRLSAAQRSSLEARIGSAFTGRTGFDEVITKLYLVGGDEEISKASQAWLTALAGSQSVPITEQTARALLDLDLRCGRCHEHPIESGIGQQDYWQFAALFNNGLYYTRSEEGETEVHLKETGLNPPEGLFFELPDGRQRVALPGVSPDWLGVAGAEPIDRLSDLSAYWIDNPQLAKSTVNRLWKIVYGRPLVGTVSDPDAPPRDEHLIELRDFLAEQLRAYDFDLATATSWILAAEPMRLKVASPMAQENIRTASTEALVQADYQTRAFAAYHPIEGRESFPSLIAMAAQWNGGTGIENLPAGSTLAQPIDVGSNRSGVQDDVFDPSKFRKQWLRASFPTVSKVTSERPDLPAQWLAALKSFDQQARHLYYAAGYWHPSHAQMQAAELLHDSSDDPNLALSQLWWAIENAAEPTAAE